MLFLQFFFVLLCCCNSWQQSFTATLANDTIQEIFAPHHKGWLGGDVATSIQLSPGRVLWLYGDTLVGKLHKKTRQILTMPRNSVGIMEQANATVFDQLDYFIITNTTNPTDEHLGFFSPKNSSSWLWLSTGGAFGFGFAGTRIVTVDNPSTSPKHWQYSVKSVPGTDGSLNWCTAAAVDELRGQIYFVGSNSTNNILARLSIADFLANVWMPMEVWSENFSWQLLAGGAIPQALTKSAISETTIHYVPGVGFLFWGIDFLATQLKVYTSPVMTGPYNAQPVFDIPAPWNNTPSVFCYAPKLHLELSDIANRRLFLTFMSNAQNVADLTTDLQVYKPVGVWIDVK